MQKYFCLVILLKYTINCFEEDNDYLKKYESNKKEDSENISVLNSYKYSDRNYNVKRYGSSRYDDSIRSYNSSKRYNDSSETGSQLEYYYDDEDFEYVGNPDFNSKIERPCPVFDLNCIRRFFAEHSKCKIRRGPLPETAFRSQFTYHIASVNLSTTLTNVRYGGIRNTRIEEFYINKETNNIVFSIQLRDLTAFVPTVYFQFYRNGREPIVTVTEAFFYFSTITFTAVIPNIDDIQLEKVEVTAFADSLPFFYIGPEVGAVADSVVLQSLLQLLSDVPLITQEFLFIDSLFYPPFYIQSNICDFELNVS